MPVIPYRPKGSKLSRAEQVAPLAEAGRVLLPESAPWLADWIEEHIRFPGGLYDDQVDTTSMALSRLRNVAHTIRLHEGPTAGRPRWVQRQPREFQLRNRGYMR